MADVFGKTDDRKTPSAGLVRQNAADLFLGILCAVIGILMIGRCFLGIDFTDESYYVAEELAMLHGNVPYAYNMSLSSGQSFAALPFIKLYELLVPSLEGIFLYSRLCYTLLRLAVVFMIYRLLRHDLARTWRILAVGVLVPFFGSVIQQNFSYNTVAVYSTLLAGVLLYTAQRDMGKTAAVKLFGAGVLTAAAVFAHPVYAFSVFVFAALVAVNSRPGLRLRRTVLYCLGGIAAILIVFIPILAAVGFEKLLYGFQTIAFYAQKPKDW